MMEERAYELTRSIGDLMDLSSDLMDPDSIISMSEEDFRLHKFVLDTMKSFSKFIEEEAKTLDSIVSKIESMERRSDKMEKEEES